MRYGAVTFIWASPFRTEDLHVVRRVADLGFDAIEVVVEEPELLDPEALRAALDDAGTSATLVGFCTAERDVSSENAAVRERGLDYLRRCVDVAAAAGATVVGGPIHEAVGQLRLLDDDARAAERERAAQSLREVADYAAGHGVALAVEPLNRFEADMVNTVGQALELCDAVGRDNVGVLLDTFHLNIEEKHIGEAIRRAGPRLLGVHASENDRGAAGSGHVPWGEVRDALAEIGYDGVVSVESFTPSVAHLAAMWRPFFDDPDEFARTGLAHLRATFG
jgi:D-psicose/D-tagatose/L-ribulose 3-epimerase